MLIMQLCSLAINPAQFDVIVTSNIFGDILSDLSRYCRFNRYVAVSVTWRNKMRYVRTDSRQCSDIAGMDIANPIATIVSAAMMLEMSFGLVEKKQRQ